MSTFVGIDVSYRTCDVAIRQNGETISIEQYDQVKSGFDKLVKVLKKATPQYIVLEATGVYHLQLALRLYEAGLPVSVINPSRFKAFMKLMDRNSKTDAQDAILLAEFAQRMEIRLWQPPEEHWFELQAISRFLGRLGSRIRASENQLHAMKAAGNTPAYLMEDEQESIDADKRRLERIRDRAIALIESREEMYVPFKNICQGKGIGQVAAVTLLGELGVLPRDMKAKQVVRHAGLDVRLTESGSSVNRPSHISKTGNVYLRSALFMPALSAKQNDIYAGAFYDKLTQRKKKKLQAICAIQRKYLMGVWACLKSETPFDSSKLFSSEHMN